ncbi:uncharacterized protein LOC131007027 isoform X2 [Salvia miltiorrhiza]|uniref:uncharacterized protein LOC131006968 isoform X2 n=1 Tax=Salvia miltiorrhiza TaxID=226208 RepID=UPI0025AD28EB|nr:uncharacterized protein LOC131006968 isoform X2 [Salvia miltiorrhiza]XP_057790163.1 uncharacterized protein LOC131007027 isoform X2 [Salvia miltiorrhiza]
MAFHVACPITCRKICFCALGFAGPLRSEKGKEDFLKEVARVELFLKDPWLIKAKENATIQVKVPKVSVSPALPPPAPQLAADVAGVGGEEASAQVKRAALQKQAAAASLVAEDYARRFESGDLEAKDAAGEEQGLSTAKVMCRICFSGENDESERARKMLSCNSCGKKYHRNCLKAWSQNRDLFHWSSWTCPSCRTCEVCRRTGDPNKFMFCKRCDGAYHCYCQQPPHKNVGHGPYLCPKHTKCHSCDSTVPGNGLSVRWLLGYTCCDACGRLFGKGNYCPVCLKVYRDSESTPMVCCDICQRWVHCPCDGISDAKYMQFQVDGNLQYVCPTCRGECPQVTNLEEAVQELWRRRDEADKDLIASLRAAAGLPTQEEIFDISPFSDDEESGPVSVKNEYGRSLKFSLKGLGNKSPRKSKEYGKKSSNKKYGKKRGNETSLISGVDTYRSLDGYGDGPSGQNTGNNKNDEMQLSNEPASAFSPVAGSLMEDTCAVTEAAASKHKYIDEVSATNVTKASRTIRIKSNKSRGFTNREEIGGNTGIPKTAQGPKLVIHLGGRSKNTSPPMGQDKTSSKGTEDTGQLKQHQEHINRPDSAAKFGEQKGLKLQVKDGPLIKLKNASNLGLSNIRGFSEGHESVSPRNTYSILGKRSAEDSASARSGPEVPASRRSKHTSIGHGEDVSASGDLIDDSSSLPSVSQAPTKERKPYLKFKIPKNSNNGNQIVSSTGNQDSLPPPGKDEITYTRGQRSKRRRPAPGDEDSSQRHEDSTIKDFTDANWILQKLGKDAAGKRVEVHQSSSNSWHRGTVVEVFEGTSVVSIALDDGKSKSFKLGKQGIRFISQKQKH